MLKPYWEFYLFFFFFSFTREDILSSNKLVYWTTLGYFNFKYTSGEYYLLNTNLGKVWLRGHFSAAMAPEALHPGRDPTLPGELNGHELNSGS